MRERETLMDHAGAVEVNANAVVEWILPSFLLGPNIMLAYV